MSATLGFNEIPYYSWKDQVFYQVSSFITENKNRAPTLSINQLMKPMPLKIYRREIASVNTKNIYSGCGNRISQSIDLINMPGSTIVSENNNYANGLVNYIDNQVTECKSTNCNINMPDIDAKRRVRSAGMMRKTYNPAQNNSSYCTDRNQYLVMRNLTFGQNQYNYIRQGNSAVKPGSSLANGNLYSPNGISHCVQSYISAANNNNTFRYTWIDNMTYSVTIPDGQYDIDLLNNAFKNAMVKNNTYFIQSGTSNVVLFRLTYDSNNKVVFINIEPYTTYITFSSGRYRLAVGYTVNTPCSWIDSSGNITVTNTNPALIIPLGNFQKIIGFTPGSYSAATQSSNIPPLITPNYVKMNYKPNNSQFGVQGAVSSSNLILRKKYDTITDVASKLQSAYGSATANALAYGVTDKQYTLKDRIGYRITQTPVISKYCNKVACMDPPIRQQIK
jgi:hypothetical protein